MAAAAFAVAALAAGCGGGDAGDPQVIAAVGDSITSGSPGYEADPALRKALRLGHNPKSQWEYWAEQKHPDLEIRNCGRRGERTDQIILRFRQCVAGADAVVIQGGTNDLAAGYPPKAVLANLRRMVRAAKAVNLDVAFADVLPYGPVPQADPIIDRLNRRIAAIGRAAGVPVLPFHRVLEDPDHPGRMKPEWTADGIHPSVEGYRRLGELAFTPPGE